MELLWGIVNYVAPLVLLAVIVWAFLRNRRAGRANLDKAERGARDLREEIDRDEARDGRA